MNRLTNIDSTRPAGPPLRRQLADVLENYLADLERGVAPDQEALLATHPELADELRPYLDSLRLLHGAASGLRAKKASPDESLAGCAESGERQIGEYRIVREIGRGGMGIVYEAHQKSLNRQVALKILPFAAVLDQRQIARFRNEAQAAAQLHHPHIVPVFAVGQELGVYYYAMQYIAGQSLAELIDAMKGEERGARIEARNPTSLKTRPALSSKSAVLAGDTRRLASASTDAGTRVSPRSVLDPLCSFCRTVARLGQEAARALQHAHDYGIIHRDIKPSNLLVDEQGKLWVTDFGLARMQSDSGVTLTGDVVGTLRYMSPEQAAGRTDLVDARTDVYSLGVTLYELLTQRPAYPGDDRQSVLRRILEEEPIAPRRLNPAVPVDLETIVLTAMAKSREERYASAQALADDLERFLAGEPTRARRPGVSDRTVKWARRHRPLVALGACSLILLSIVSAAGVVLLAREQARTAKALAEAEASARTAQVSFERAERHFRQARGTVDQFGVRLADRLLDVPGAEPVRRDVLIETLRYYRQFMAEAADDPQLRQELALAHFKSGVIAARLGAAADAIAEYQAAQELFTELAGDDSSRTEPRSQLAVTHNNLALLLAARGDVDGARQHYGAAIDIQEQLITEHAAHAGFASQLAETQANLGVLLDQIGNAAEAEQSLRKALEVLHRLAESQAGESRHARNLAMAYNNLSFVLRKRDAGASVAAARQAIAILERLVEQHTGREEYQDDLALCWNNLAALASHQGRLDEAIEGHGRAIALYERLARKAPAVVRHRSDLAISFNNLGVAHSRAGHATDSDAAFGSARKLLSTLADDYPEQLAYRSSLAALLNNQALALAAAGRHADALVVYATAIDSQRTCHQRRPQSATMRESLSKMYYNYGRSLQKAQRLAEAADAALARRQLWQNDGDRLVGVAAELADVAGEVVSADALRERLHDEIAATLHMAYQSGWPRGIDLATDERFVSLHSHERIAALIAELNQRPSKAQAKSGPIRSSSTVN